MYARIGLETGVTAASPHHLVLMLFDGALGAVADADSHLVAGRIAEKGAAISRAIAIINDGLRASLDPTRGGKIAGYLLELYDYMVRRLLLASLENDRAVLREISRLLGELRSSWAAIANTAAKAIASPVLASHQEAA
jgi:flagellar protein FliS